MVDTPWRGTLLTRVGVLFALAGISMLAPAAIPRLIPEVYLPVWTDANLLGEYVLTPFNYRNLDLAFLQSTPIGWQSQESSSLAAVAHSFCSLLSRVAGHLFSHLWSVC